jgi:hypothetical protein
VVSAVLEVSCAEGRGSITIVTETAVPNPDPDGYRLQLDDGTAWTLDGNGLLTYSAIPVGDHTLLLSSVAANCAVSGPNPRTVAVASAAETTVTFNLTCGSIGPGTLLISSDRSGQDHVYRVEPDGTGLEDLTPDADGGSPDWSPDRSRIAFGSSRSGEPRVYVMDADGSSPARLASGVGPVWSPDGHRIAFTGSDGVTVMNADVSDPVVLAPGYSPAWSPDGTRIAFTRECCFLGGDQRGVKTIAPSGGGTISVYAGRARGRSVWSPDGDPRLRRHAGRRHHRADADAVGRRHPGGGGRQPRVRVSGLVAIARWQAPAEWRIVPMRHTMRCLALLVIGWSAELGCGTATDLAPAGEIGVHVTTTGPELDPDGYRVTVDGASARSLGVEGSTLFQGLEPGTHAIELIDLADNCAVRGAGLRSATVTTGATTTVNYAVTCAATAALRVTTTSDGAPADPDGYELMVQERGARAIGANQTITMAGFPAGVLTIELTGLAATCAIPDGSARRVPLVGGDTAEVTFAVHCAPLPPAFGTIQVNVNTTVINALTPTGYTVTLDDSTSRSIGANGILTFVHLSPGLHSVGLSGAPSYCAVGGFFPGANPVSVRVVGDSVSLVRFGVLCLG